MIAERMRETSIVGRIGWILMLGVAGLLVVHGAFWLFEGPEVLLDNIAERLELSTSAFMQGEPSAFKVIALTARGYALLELALGTLALILGWRGLRRGAASGRTAMWIVTALIAALAVNFILVGGAGVGASYLVVALIGFGGLLLSGTDK